MPNDFHYSLSMERYRVSHVSEQIPNALRDTNPAPRAKPRGGVTMISPRWGYCSSSEAETRISLISAFFAEIICICGD